MKGWRFQRWRWSLQHWSWNPWNRGPNLSLLMRVFFDGRSTPNVRLNKIGWEWGYCAPTSKLVVKILITDNQWESQCCQRYWCVVRVLQRCAPCPNASSKSIHPCQLRMRIDTQPICPWREFPPSWCCLRPLRSAVAPVDWVCSFRQLKIRWLWWTEMDWRLRHAISTSFNWQTEFILLPRSNHQSSGEGFDKVDGTKVSLNRDIRISIKALASKY